MPKIKIDRAGQYIGAPSLSYVIRALAEGQCAAAVDAANIAALTGTGGGTASAAIVLPTLPADNPTATGAVLAPKAGTEASLVLVRDALGEVRTKTAAIAAVIGLDPITDNSGAVTGDGTIGAITTALTAAATGVTAANLKASVAGLNDYMATVAAMVNATAAAVGLDTVSIYGSGISHASTIPVVPVTTGTAVAGGILATDMTALLVIYAEGVAKLVAMVALIVAVDGKPRVVAV